jgi:hypothetical protein
MTPDMVTELLRNLYSASGGSVPPTAVASAIAGLMWNEHWQSAWDSAFKTSDAVVARGGSDEEISEAFNNAFAEGLGWTRGDFDRFLDENNLTSDNARQYQEGVDLWDWMVRRR